LGAAGEDKAKSLWGRAAPQNGLRRRSKRNGKRRIKGSREGHGERKALRAGLMS